VAVAETKHKLSKQRSTTRRQDLQDKCTDAKAEVKRLKALLTAWNKNFVTNNDGRLPNNTDKESDPVMRQTFFDYIEASNRHKLLTQELSA
jgi:hypothetical protein